MNAFEYVSVLYSIVVSLAVTHLLVGLGRIIRAPKVRFSLVHAGWVVYMFFQCVDFWFSIWRTRDSILNVGLAVYAFAIAAALYLSCWLVMPEIRPDETVDLVAVNDRDRRKYLGAFIVYSALGALGILATNGLRPALWAPVIGILASAAAWIWRNRGVQATALAAIYAATVLYFFRYLWVL